MYCVGSRVVGINLFALAVIFLLAYGCCAVGASAAPTYDLSVLSNTQGFTITGGGFSVSGAGDVNGDGVDDVIAGIYWANANTGVAAVVFGNKSGVISNLDFQTFAAGPSTGFHIHAPAPGVLIGFSVSKAGDMNGDGVSDVIVGAPESDLGAKTNAGITYVIFGRKVTSRVNAFQDIHSYDN